MLNAIAFYSTSKDRTYILINRSLLERADLQNFGKLEILDKAINKSWGFVPDTECFRFFEYAYPDEELCQWDCRFIKGEVKTAKVAVRLLNGTLNSSEELKDEYIEIK